MTSGADADQNMTHRVPTAKRPSDHLAIGAACPNRGKPARQPERRDRYRLIFPLALFPAGVPVRTRYFFKT